MTPISHLFKERCEMLKKSMDLLNDKRSFKYKFLQRMLNMNELLYRKYLSLESEGFTGNIQ